MDRPILEIDLSSPFGSYSLSPRQQIALTLAKKTRSKKLVNIIRQIGGLRSCKIADVEVYGSKMRLYPALNRSDKIMLGMPHIFDASEREALATHLKQTSNNSFIDLGANIGSYSLFVNSLGLDTKIVSIEADPETYARLNFNLPQNVKALNIAVAAEEGSLPFYIHATNRGENSLVESENSTRIDVPAKRMVQVMDEEGIETPGVLKIDVEGAEFNILQKFYDDAPKARWPELVVMEHFHSKKALELLFSKGYSEVLRTKLNIVLKK